MYTVLIVEDEPLVRIGLKCSISWEKLNMNVIADVPNGRDALEVYHKSKPDLILTDIKMPVMDGMRLISAIRAEDNATKIIILTCFEEFDLAQKAIQLGVSNYILKMSMNPKDIEAVLSKVSDELKREREHFKQNPPINLDPGLVKENLFKQFIFYSLYSEQDFSLAVEQLNLRLSPQNIVLCALCVDQFSALQDKFKDRQGDIIRFAVINIIDEILTGFKRGEAFHEKEGRYILLLSFPDIKSQNDIQKLVQEILSRAGSAIETYVGGKVAFYRSSVCQTYASLPLMYDECLAAMEESRAKTRLIKPEIAEVITFIEKNYSRNISLTEAADNVEMSASYLSSLFKSETGQSFTDYLNMVRINRAKDILLNSRAKTYEVAEMAGYLDTSYFIRQFKKYTGMKPNDFRKLPYKRAEGSDRA